MLRSLRIFLFACAVLLPCAVLLTEIVLYSQNSLYLNDRWIAQKRMMKMGILRADEFLLTRTPLARNLLNLGSYHGYQEVIYRQLLTPGQIEFRFQVENESYLDLTYNRDGANYSGLRLSRRADMPSIVFESTEQGRFRSVNSVPVQVIGPGWHKASIRSSSSGLIVKIDHQTSAIPTASRFTAGLVGFRAGMNGARIDDVAIRPLMGPSFREGFRNSKNWPRSFAGNFGLVILFGALLSRITLGKFWVVTKEGLFYWTLIGVVGFLCAGSWYLFDYYYYSKRIPRDSGITRPLFHKEGRFSFPSFERLRFVAFEAWYGLAGGEAISHQGMAHRGYPAPRIFHGPIYCGPAKEPCVEGVPPALNGGKSDNSPAYRVLFIGSSQTVGAGASGLEDTFFVRVHRYLSEALPPKIRLESVNASVSGYRSADLLREYQSRYRDFQPDLVVINLSNNDRSPEKFAAAMTGFLDLNRTAGIKTILLQEANSTEMAQPKRLLANHEVLRQLGEEYQVAVFPLHGFLSESARLGNGPLWWDMVHLTSLGQEVTAGWLAPQLLNSLLASPPVGAFSR